jgi:hypothetical protein
MTAIGVPAPTPSSAACTARGLVVFARLARRPPASTSRPIARSVSTYHRARIGSNCGIDRSKNLPQTVTISAGQTIRLDISIDTGIR